MRASNRKNHGQTQKRLAEPRTGAASASASVSASVSASASTSLPGALPALTEEAIAALLTRTETLGTCPPPLDVPQEIKPLDDTWCQWIADNTLRRVSPESIMKSVTEAGIDPAQASGFMASLPRNPGYRAAEKMRERYERFGRAMRHVQSLRESAPDYAQVEKRTHVDREEFLERYVRGCRPVVLTELARDWPALQRWSFPEFKRRYGALTVQVQSGRDADDNFEVNKDQHKRQTNFASFVDRILTTDQTNDEYLTANNELLRRPEFNGLLDELGTLPEYCIQSALRHSAYLWVGPAGTKTPLHHDTVMLFHTQIVGRKRWRFVSPLSSPSLYNDFDVYSPVDFEALDLARFPEAAKVKVLDVVVEPGETVFLPLAWWHQVTSLDRCISLSFTQPRRAQQQQVRLRARRGDLSDALDKARAAGRCAAPPV